MTLGNLSYMKEISVENSGKIPLGRNGLYQSDFEVVVEGTKTRVIVFANQPIHYQDGEFKIDPREIAELMCYSKFRVSEIICCDLRETRHITGPLMTALESLVNL